MSTITIIDYGTSNLGSMKNMLKKLGVASRLATTADEVMEAEKIILPGVGAFDAGMRTLKASGMVEALHVKVLEQRVPILGVCLGMQMMGLASEEGSEAGLGWVDARSVRFRSQDHPGMRVPHMGWNEVRGQKPSPLLSEPPERLRFYFANSYHVVCADPADVLLETDYAGFHFTSAFEKGHIRGAQFHPEKSHRYGMWFLNNFASRT
ncbi:imidazole glycerol phosphate synthase subunit HisH [Hoeflea olei]|uniref:Imidazole glycerol phosphate synthase subunit HisH n=1 Tax=Hoeflea olei TaxID=1480615 RepID=A0A1C1YU22_9HYPH|nr:imidazole glycerol phosphate synthase subunit HisH [Hoeflea olei]OCW57009.1 imidazole glycerol phosphate synthase subunit HisH [Hoeflea olei]